MSARPRILFLTGKLARVALERVIEAMPAREFDYEVRDVGLSVAALMTSDMLGRRVTDTGDAERVIVPGLCAGNLDSLAAQLGVPVERGPDDLKDLPEHLGGKAREIDLTGYRVRIFAEIVDAPQLDVAQIVARAAALRTDGADVIDLGCLPGAGFAHLEECVRALKGEGHAVSVDSLDVAELRRGAAAGADYLLSLRPDMLDVVHEVDSTPVLIPQRPGDLDSLVRASQALTARGRAHLVDSILDPLHFGFAASVTRYQQLRERLPEADILVGTGNLTELTDADTTGVTMLLLGVCSELDAAAILTTQVSGHARTAVREADRARRIVYAAKADAALPRGYDAGLLALRDRRPFLYSSEEVAETAAAIKDPSFRIQVNEDGVHVYNRDGLHVATDPYELFPHLDVETDGGHAFYLGMELARAQIAWQLGKRYRQDEMLRWGCVGSDAGERRRHAADASQPASGTTQQASRRQRKAARARRIVDAADEESS